MFYISGNLVIQIIRLQHHVYTNTRFYCHQVAPFEFTSYGRYTEAFTSLVASTQCNPHVLLVCGEGEWGGGEFVGYPQDHRFCPYMKKDEIRGYGLNPSQL